jgi:hypothetical protein
VAARLGNRSCLTAEKTHETAETTLISLAGRWHALRAKRVAEGDSEALEASR